MDKIIHINQEGLNLIKWYEGFKSFPYLCPAGIPTIGYGSTRYPNGTKVTLNDKHITEQEGSNILLETLSTYEQGVDAICIDTISQNQFNALVSFAYNLGLTALKGSTLLKMVNTNPNDLNIRTEFNKWIHGGGQILPGLILRRKAEAELYFK